MSDTATRMLADAIAHQSGDRIQLTTHTVHSVNPLRLRGIDDDPVTVQHTTTWPVSPGDQVLTIRTGPTLWVIGPVTATSPPPTGIVASVSGSLVTVSLGGAWGSAALPSTATVTAGQRVGIAWQWTGTRWEGFIAGVVTTNPGGATPTPPPSTEADTRTSTPRATRLHVHAAETKTWRNGWRGDTDNLYQGNAGRFASSPAYRVPQHGYWFYGRGAFDDGRGRTCARISLDEVRVLRAGDGAAVPVRFRLHGATVLGRNEPTPLPEVYTVSLAPGTHRNVALPASAGQKLLDGAANGVAIISDTTAEYRGITGLSGHAASGALTIDTTD